MATGIGFMCGPVIGSFLYNSFGFKEAFFVFSSILILSAFISSYYLPKELNENDQEELIARASLTTVDAPYSMISYSQFFKNKRTFLGLTTGVYVSLAFNFFTPFMTPMLEHEKHIPVTMIGSLISLHLLVYMLFTLTTGFIFQCMIKRRFIFLAFLGSTLGLYLMGSFPTTVT